ncbi:DUF4399 domain-containing protein [Streptomyces flaveolus]|uniref:DUF4399 domain-containing protein n=1 Tax=Streptomyces flaveolus TaxID=67297 RepID=UPI0036FCED5C
MGLRPAGDMTPGTGHHCLLLDGRPIPRGNVVPVGERSLCYGKAQSEAGIRLPPGQQARGVDQPVGHGAQVVVVRGRLGRAAGPLPSGAAGEAQGQGAGGLGRGGGAGSRAG